MISVTTALSDIPWKTPLQHQFHCHCPEQRIPCDDITTWYGLITRSIGFMFKCLGTWDLHSNMQHSMTNQWNYKFYSDTIRHTGCAINCVEQDNLSGPWDSHSNPNRPMRFVFRVSRWKNTLKKPVGSVQTCSTKKLSTIIQAAKILLEIIRGMSFNLWLTKIGSRSIRLTTG